MVMGPRQKRMDRMCMKVGGKMVSIVGKAQRDTLMETFTPVSS